MPPEWDPAMQGSSSSSDRTSSGCSTEVNFFLSYPPQIEPKRISFLTFLFASVSLSLSLDLTHVQSLALSSAIPLTSSARATSTDSYLAIHCGSRGAAIESRLYRLEPESRSLVEVAGPARAKGTRIAVWRDVDSKGELARPETVKSAAQVSIRRTRDDQGGDLTMRDGNASEDDDEDEELYGSSTADKRQPARVPIEVGIEIEKEHASVDQGRVEQARADSRHVGNEEVGNVDRDWLVQIDHSGTLTVSEKSLILCVRGGACRG